VQPIEVEPNRYILLWEHDALQPYDVPRHMVSSAAGARWSVVTSSPLTLTPSLHCDKNRGGCGAHGFVTSGRWV
jgi:hypothetical protein